MVGRRSTSAGKATAPVALVHGAPVSLGVDEARGARIVVVADTHGQPHEASRGLIAAIAPAAIIHAGDIGGLAVLDALQTLAPVYAVRGNVDEHRPETPDVLPLHLEGRRGRLLTLLALHIGVYGPKLRPDAAQLAATAGADVVLCGHSHVPFLGRDRGLVVFNPGALGPKRFQLPTTFGVIEIDEAGVRMHHVDCLTGARWKPRSDSVVRG